MLGGQECCQQGALPFPRRPRQRAVSAPFCSAKVTTVAHAYKPELINIRPYETLDLIKTHFRKNTVHENTLYKKLDFIKNETL